MFIEDKVKTDKHPKDHLLIHVLTLSCMCSCTVDRSFVDNKAKTDN